MSPLPEERRERASPDRWYDRFVTSLMLWFVARYQAPLRKTIGTGVRERAPRHSFSSLHI